MRRTFKLLLLKKIKDDIKNPNTKKAAVKLLIEPFGNLLSDNKFLSSLANKLDYFPSRLKTLTDNHEKVFLPRNCIPNDVLKEIYHFWIKNSIPSTDRDLFVMKCVSLKWITCMFTSIRWILWTKISLNSLKLKKNRASKSYMKSQRMIYTKKIRKMHTDVVASRDNIQCSLSTFLRYKAFYITPPSETEKESCICMKCQNVHLLLQEIKTYRSTQNLSKHHSFTELLNSEPPINSNNFPECNDTKEINYYIFEIKTESEKNRRVPTYNSS